MAGGLQKYTVVESNNLGLGQVGSAYFNGTNTYTPQSGKVVIAIQVIDDCVFSSATVAESTDFTDQDTAEGGTNADVFGTDTFPAGVTIYGRWTAVQLTTAGAVMLYMGS
tara:strand:+ start:156 stop:485 length:330 start_codon:yes stop_codon:yes gene_type:complete